MMQKICPVYLLKLDILFPILLLGMLLSSSFIFIGLSIILCPKKEYFRNNANILITLLRIQFITLKYDFE